MELKPGYKQTEVGVIPEEWDVIRLSELTSEIGDGIHSTPEYVKSSTYYFINGNNLVDGTILIADTTMCVSEAEWQKLRKHLSGQTILMSINGTIGNLACYRGESVVLGKSAAYLNIASGISKEYVLYSLSTSLTAKYFENELTGTTIKNLSLVSLRNTPVPIPREMEEQHAIVAALGDVDALLGALEKLIAKKRDLKQATMQQLLTGQTRLPGFSGKWEVKRLGDLLTYERPDKYIVRSTEYLEGANVPVLTANKSFVLGFTNESFGVFRDLPVVIFDDFTTDSKYVDFQFKVKSSAIKILSKTIDSVNLRYVFERMQLIQFPLGDHKRYYISEYQNIKFPVPQYKEQDAIMSVLSEMDAAIAALEARLAKTRALKQGMMQELLTGRTRLV